MPTNQQNNKSGTQGSNRQNENERDRKMSDSDRGQQGKAGMVRDQESNSQGRNDNARSGGDRSQR